MRIVAIAARTVRWPIAGQGAARGRSERAAVLLEVRSDGGAIGLGEAAPLPGMSRDTLEQAEAALAAFAKLVPFELAVRDAAHVGAPNPAHVGAPIPAHLTAPVPAHVGAPVPAHLAAPVAAHVGAPVPAHVGAPRVDRGTTYVPDTRTPFEILDHRAARAFAAAPLAARFAIETALGDAIARDRGMSLAALFSPAHVGAPSRVPLAAVVDDAEAARRAWAAGIRCLKIKLGADDDLDRVIAIARAAPGATLRIDANRSWPRGEVAARLAALAPLRVEYVEEPCRDAHELLRSGPLAGKLALDESLSELALEDLRAALGSPGLAAVILKPTLLGGLSVALELAALARRAGVAAVASHALEGPIGTAACAELALALGGEHAAGLARHAGLDGWSVEVAQLADDHLHPAAAAGLGFEDLDLDGAVGACRTRLVGHGGDLP